MRCSASRSGSHSSRRSTRRHSTPSSCADSSPSISPSASPSTCGRASGGLGRGGGGGGGGGGGVGVGPRRRLVRWVLAIGVLFLLVSLGGATPFYRLWWAIVPYVKKTRAPGIAFYVVALAVSMLAAAGA